MHILFFSHYFPPEVNAPATRTFEHCKRWVKAGHEVSVITGVPNCPDGVVYNGYRNRLYQTEIVEGVRVIRVWTFIAANKGFFMRILNYLSYMKIAIIVGIFQRNIDVIVATSPQFFCGWTGVLVHWIRGWPFILEIRDIWPESILAVGAMKKSCIIKFLEVLEKVMYKVPCHIVTVGNGYKRKIVEKGVPEKKISVVINGVDLQQFQTIENVEHIRKLYHAEGKFVCSYIGTVGMAHGLDVVIKAAEQARILNKKDLMFWIIGDGACKMELKELAVQKGLSNVIFTDRLPKKKIPEIISISDACLVHLRGTELFKTVIPSKIFEFMAMNVPVIMGVKGEALDIVLNGNAGIEMVPDSAESLLECIAVIQKQGKENCKGRDYTATFFDRNKLAGEMLDVLSLYTRE